MRGFQMRQLLLLSVLLVGVTWAAAQSDSTQKTPSGSQTTVQGCLGGADGHYTLIDKNGTSYQLTGDTAKLKDHVGHEVEVTGTTSSSSGASSGQGGSGMSEDAATPQAIQVTAVRMLSKTCQK
jgi:hypothetical protein